MHWRHYSERCFFIIPVFGILWAVLFLGESMTSGMLAGAALVIAGTILVLR